MSAAAKSRQSCLTLCDPIDSSPPGSAIPGILQARILEWVAISFSIMSAILHILFLILTVTLEIVYFNPLSTDVETELPIS